MECKFEIIKAYIVKLFCDDCDTEINGDTCTCDIIEQKAVFTYTCPNCSKIIKSPVRYPYVSYNHSERL